MKAPVFIVYRDGKTNTFQNVEVARKALNLSRDRLIEIIMTGEDTEGYSLDWGASADDADTAGIEERWTIRKERLAEKKRRSRENAAQKDLQGVWVQESYVEQDGHMRHVRITAESLVKLPTDDGDRLSD